MGAFPQNTRPAFELPPAGAHIARIHGVVDIGTQASTNPQYGPQRQIIFFFELPTTLMSTGLPFTTNAFMPFSAYKGARLAKALASWMAISAEEVSHLMETDDDFLKKLFRIPGQIQITHKEKAGGGMKSEVSAYMAMPNMPQGFALPACHNPIIYFNMQEGHYYPECLDNIPDWAKKKLQLSDEWADVQARPDDFIAPKSRFCRTPQQAPRQAPPQQQAPQQRPTAQAQPPRQQQSYAPPQDDGFGDDQGYAPPPQQHQQRVDHARNVHAEAEAAARSRAPAQQQRAPVNRQIDDEIPF